MRVEGRAELTLQELDVVARPLDRVEGVAARDSGARRPDCSGFLQDVFVPRDALLVREDDVLVHLLVRDGAVEAVERADARDKEDHLRSVRALTATDRKLAAGEPTEGALFEAHAQDQPERRHKDSPLADGPRELVGSSHPSMWRSGPLR